MQSQQPFISPRLTGRRFDDHTVPLEILEDFAAFEELLVEVAKFIYINGHPDRKRVPNGFTDGVSLKLAGVEEGSSILKVLLITASMSANINSRYFEEAKDKIVECIDAAQSNRQINGIIPDNLLLYFNKIGKRLKADEAIDFSKNTRHNNAVLNNTSRTQLVMASSANSLLSRQVRVIATIPVVDKQKQSYVISLEDGTRISRGIEGVHSVTINEAYKHYEENAKVAIIGSAIYNRANKLQDFEYVEHISILDPLDVPLRLQELSKLSDGWLGDGDGIAPKKEHLNLLENLFDTNFDYSNPLPYLYPTPTGGIQMEWHNEEYDISLEIDFDANVGSFNALNLSTDGETSFDIKIDDPHGWVLLNSSLSTHLNES